MLTLYCPCTQPVLWDNHSTHLRTQPLFYRQIYPGIRTPIALCPACRAYLELPNLFADAPDLIGQN